MLKINLVPGQKFGFLEFLAESSPVKLPCGQLQRVVLVRCECGVEKTVRLANLTNGNTVSCGCFRKSKDVFNPARTHGKNGHPLHRIWRSMRDRCKYKGTKSYDRYGGRGIKVCKEWDDSFVAFYDWAVSHGWVDGLQIDRIDNDAGYYPENCHFVTNMENNRNRSDNRMITHKGKTQCALDWAREIGIGYSTFLERLYAGWTIEEAIETPKGVRRGWRNRQPVRQQA